MQVNANSTHLTQDPLDHQVIEVELVGPDQRLITGSFWKPAQNQPCAGLVCFGHGASGDRYQHPIPTMAQQLRTHNLASLALDGPVHGARKLEGVQPRDAFMQAFAEGTILTSMTQDWQTGLAWATQELDANDSASHLPFGYFGLSMGTLLGLPFLAANPLTNCAVVGLAGLSQGLPHCEQLTTAASTLQCPVLMLQNLQDELFSADMYQQLFASIGTENKRLHANPGKHDHMADDQVKLCLDFLIEHLTSPPASRTYRSIIDGTLI